MADRIPPRRLMPGRVQALPAGMIPDKPLDDEQGPAQAATLAAAAAEMGSRVEANDAAVQEVLAERGPGFVRQPFGAQRLKLSYPKRPGFRRYWFNEVGDRLAVMEKGGYRFVKDANGKPVVRTVDRQTGQQSYLMEIPEIWFAQDMAAIQALVDETDEAIRGGNVQRSPGDGRYVPTRPDGAPMIDIRAQVGRR